MMKLIRLLSLMTLFVGCEGKYKELREYYIEECKESATVKFKNLQFESKCNGRNIFATMITSSSSIVQRQLYNVFHDYLSSDKPMNVNLIDSGNSTILDLIIKHNKMNILYQLSTYGHRSTMRTKITKQNIFHRIHSYRHLERNAGFIRFVEMHPQLLKQTDHLGRTPFELVVEMENYPLAWMYHEAISQKNTILAYAQELTGNFLFDGHLIKDRTLVKQLASIYEKKFQYYEIYDFSFIHFAAKENAPWLIDHLQSLHIDMTAESSIGNALDVAAYFGSADAIEVLIDKGFVPTQKTLLYAVQNCQGDAIKKLREKGVRLYSYEGITSIKHNARHSAKYFHLSEAAMLDEMRKDSGWGDDDYHLFQRCHLRYGKADKELFRKLLPINDAFIRAAIAHKEESEYSQKYTNDWERTNAIGQSFLFILISNMHHNLISYEDIQFIIENQAERFNLQKNKIDQLGMNLLHYWLINMRETTESDFKLFKNLASRGIDLNQINARGETILHIMARNGLIGLAKKIVSRSVRDVYKFKKRSLKKINVHNQRASAVAEENGHTLLAEFLKKKGA